MESKLKSHRTDSSKQILRALSGKVPVETSEDLNDIAAATEGYSGADLQAVLYNAHLASIHEYIEKQKDRNTENFNNSLELPEYVEIGGAETLPCSLAEKEVEQKKVSCMGIGKI